MVPSRASASPLPPTTPQSAPPRDASDLTAPPGDCDNDSSDAEPQDVGLNDATGAEAKTVWATQCEDYSYRGEALSAWPLYFYVAAVSRCAAGRKQPPAHAFPFDPGHPAGTKLLQKVRTKNAWCVPELAGPMVPSADKDPEKRAMILLILLKPWRGCVASVLDKLGAPGRHISWTAAFDEFSAALQAQLGTRQTARRPATFTPAYWAFRTLAVIQNFDNMSLSRVDMANAGVRQNPDAAMGVAGSRDVTVHAATADADAEDMSPSDADAASAALDDLPDDADTARITFAQDDGRAEAKFAAPWELLNELIHGESELFLTCRARPKVGATTRLSSTSRISASLSLPGGHAGSTSVAARRCRQTRTCWSSAGQSPTGMQPSRATTRHRRRRRHRSWPFPSSHCFELPMSFCGSRKTGSAEITVGRERVHSTPSKPQSFSSLPYGSSPS